MVQFKRQLTYKFFRDPERYDIVIFRYPDDEKRLFVKRVIGLPGETVTIINGKVLYKDREYVDIDEEAINAWTLEQSKKLWGELNHRQY